MDTHGGASPRWQLQWKARFLLITRRQCGGPAVSFGSNPETRPTYREHPLLAQLCRRASVRSSSQTRPPAYDRYPPL
jgi:hypothetical protein